MNLGKLVFCSIVFVLCASALVFAQAGGDSEIRGRIQDERGGLIAGATVVAIDTNTGNKRTTVSDGSGEYRLLSLYPQVYKLKVSAKGFDSQEKTVEIRIGRISKNDFQLKAGSQIVTVDVTNGSREIEIEKTYQSNTITENYIRNLPIDRRDFLTFSLLAPGVSDSTTLTDNSDFRLVQVPSSGLSFYGSNGRGNNVTIDGAEANDLTGGVRSTLSQEAIQEFQINRSNYNAEFGSASGGVINIVSKTGTNKVRGSVFSYFRHQNLDAGDPFAITLEGNNVRRVKPDSNRQQFGGTIGFPIIENKTFLFASYEGLRLRESSSVPLLTNLSIFNPTDSQQSIIDTLAASNDPAPIDCLNGRAQVTRAACAGILINTLTANQDTEDLFRNNSGVFPFNTDSHLFSVRLDHLLEKDSIYARYSLNSASDDNQETRALFAFSRSSNSDILDNNIAGGWTRIVTPNVVNELQIQWNHRDFDVIPNDPNGPAFNLPGFGFFNRDISLPSITRERQLNIKDNLTVVSGDHSIKLGGGISIRKFSLDWSAFLNGRFNFSTLPGGLISPQLASTTITPLQSLDLGIPTLYQQGFGDASVQGTVPYYAGFVQDTWNVTNNFTVNLGIRYELDQRLKPLPTYKKNFAPRVAFSWSPSKNQKTVIRGGYGIYYAPIYFFLDYAVNALNEIDGVRQVQQVATIFSAANPFGATGPPNVFRTLKDQGVIGVPNTIRTITADDLAQFGFTVSATGPRNRFSGLFREDSTFRNPMTQQASVEFEQEFSPGFTASFSYIWSLTHHIVRSRDINLLPRPIGPNGIREWSAASGCGGAAIFTCFRDPFLFQEILYESAASASYNGFIVEVNKRFGENVTVSGNYTLSKAYDMVTDFNSDFRAFDQTDQRAERALSAFDQRHKFVAYALINSSSKNPWLRDFSFSPIVRANSGHPFNLLAGSDVNGDRSSSGDRPIGAGRNTGIGPSFFTLDARLSRKFQFGNERQNLEFTIEAFNVLNNLNYSSINNTVGASFTGPFNVSGSDDRSPTQPLGFTSAHDPRRLQIGVKLSF